METITLVEDKQISRYFKVLINTPNLKKDNGGVANHFIGLSKYFPKEQIRFCYTGGLRDYNKFIAFPIYFYQYFKFIYYLIVFKPDLVHLNPSLYYDSVIRDGIYLLISKAFKKEVIVFWHGWKINFEKLIDSRFLKSFIRIFNKSDGFIVISSHVKTKLIKWGFLQPIILTTTKVDDYLVDNFNINRKNPSMNVLFLGRLEEKKGIFETLRAFQLSRKNFPNLTLTFAGTGADEKKLLSIIETEKIQNVYLIGLVKNKEKIDTFLRAGIFILPSYTEGMPTTILEAMAFGIPVITRPVGGIPDFFINEKMGYMIESLDPNDFANKINFLYNNEKKWKEISQFNHEYALRNFLASNVTQKLMSYYQYFLNYKLNK